MDFSRPQLLWLLTILMPMMLVGRRARRRKNAELELLGQTGLRSRERGILWGVATVFLIIAVAGPWWQFSSRAEVVSGHEIVLLLDVSRSMAAEDAIPNRLRASVDAAESLVAGLPSIASDRVAVVSFSGRGVLKCPMTENLGAVIETLGNLEVGTDAAPGTNLGDGLLTALNVFDGRASAKRRTIVIFTDGEDHSGAWPGVLGRIRESGIEIHSVVVGDDTQGATIPIVRGTRVENLKYRGAIVRSKRDETALRALQKASGGTLIVMGRESTDLSSFASDRIHGTSPTSSWRFVSSGPEPLYAFFLMTALIVIVLALSSPSRRLLGLVFLFAMNSGFAPAEETLEDLMRSGERAFGEGNFARALAAYEKAVRLDTDSLLTRYNLAAALFQLRRYEEAKQAYALVRDRADDRLRVKVDFALGNVAVMEERYEEALRFYDACLGAKIGGKEVIALKADALANREFATSLISPPSSPDPDGKRKTRKSKPQPKSSKPTDSSSNPRPQEKQGEPSATNPNGLSAGSAGSTGGGIKEGESTQPEPEQRLNAMLEAVRKGQAARRSDRTVAQPLSDDVKDW